MSREKFRGAALFSVFSVHVNSFRYYLHNRENSAENVSITQQKNKKKNGVYYGQRRKYQGDSFLLQQQER